MKHLQTLTNDINIWFRHEEGMKSSPDMLSNKSAKLNEDFVTEPLITLTFITPVKPQQI